jgi:hypothetical protein
MERTHVSAALLRSCCEFLGRLYATAGQLPHEDYAHLRNEVDHMLRLLEGTPYYPETGDGSLGTDWMRWHLDAYEAELDARKSAETWKRYGKS